MNDDETKEKEMIECFDGVEREVTQEDWSGVVIGLVDFNNFHPEKGFAMRLFTDWNHVAYNTIESVTEGSGKIVKKLVLNNKWNDFVRYHRDDDCVGEWYEISYDGVVAEGERPYGCSPSTYNWDRWVQYLPTRSWTLLSREEFEQYNTRIEMSPKYTGEQDGGNMRERAEIMEDRAKEAGLEVIVE